MSTESTDLFPLFRLSGRSGFTNWLKDQSGAELVFAVGYIHPGEEKYRLGYLFKWEDLTQMTLSVISCEFDFYDTAIEIIYEDL